MILSGQRWGCILLFLFIPFFRFFPLRFISVLLIPIHLGFAFFMPRHSFDVIPKSPFSVSNIAVYRCRYVIVDVHMYF